VAAATGNAEQAVAIVASAAAAVESTGLSLEPFEQAIHDRTIDTARHALDGQVFAAAWATGEQLTLDEAAARAPTRASDEAGIAHS
jgi:hypothetical protein